MATGCLSVPKDPDIAGAGRFAGEVYFTEPLAARGRRLHRQAGRRDRHRLVSGIQSIPIIAQQAERAHRLPAHAELLAPARTTDRSPRTRQATFEADRADVPGGGALVGRRRARRAADRDRSRCSTTPSASAALEQHVAAGRASRDRRAFNDLLANPRPTRSSPSSCATRSARSSTTPRRPSCCAPRTIRSAPSGRASTPNYYATFNLPHVRLVDLRANPIETITETGIDDRRTGRRDLRVRRHRVRHRLRRHDRRDRQRRHHRPRRAHASPTSGRTAPRRTSA